MRAAINDYTGCNTCNRAQNAPLQLPTGMTESPLPACPPSQALPALLLRLLLLLRAAAQGSFQVPHGPMAQLPQGEVWEGAAMMCIGAAAALPP